MSLNLHVVMEKWAKIFPCNNNLALKPTSYISVGPSTHDCQHEGPLCVVNDFHVWNSRTLVVGLVPHQTKGEENVPFVLRRSLERVSPGKVAQACSRREKLCSPVHRFHLMPNLEGPTRYDQWEDAMWQSFE